MKSFIMMGQSNMAGRGNFREVEPIEGEHLFMLRNGRWQPLGEPINCDRAIKLDGVLGRNSGISMAGSFAECYAEHYGEDVGLIPCADGGTSLEDWAIDGLLFTNAFYQASLAMRTSEIVGILWHQGESDSFELETTQTYKERFLAMMTEFQKRLGIHVPVVIGELGYFLEECPLVPYYKETNRALHEIAELDGYEIASADGLTDRGDKIHFSSTSQRVFGRRYFEAYQKIVEK